MDKLNLLHPSLGLAFTAEFAHRVPGYPPCIIHGNTKIDGLPDGCTGCKVNAANELQCCQEDEG